LVAASSSPPSLSAPHWPTPPPFLPQWTSDKKDELYDAWDPNSPRSPTNFNPFETDKVGNSPNESGYFPGEGAYKDPMRPDVSWATMQEDNVKKAAREASPKDGDVLGAPGCVKGKK
jgi:hypothetical protein